MTLWKYPTVVFGVLAMELVGFGVAGKGGLAWNGYVVAGGAALLGLILLGAIVSSLGACVRELRVGEVGRWLGASLACLVTLAAALPGLAVSAFAAEYSLPLDVVRAAASERYYVLSREFVLTDTAYRILGTRALWHPIWAIDLRRSWTTPRMDP